jgi:hypothetical protein
VRVKNAVWKTVLPEILEPFEKLNSEHFRSMNVLNIHKNVLCIAAMKLK